MADPSSGVAIFSQIVRQVKFAIAEQTLRPGQLLPSVRYLAGQLAVNPNTVSRAFQELQAGQITEPLRGRGMVVSQGTPARCREQRLVLRIKLIVAAVGLLLTTVITGLALAVLLPDAARRSTVLGGPWDWLPRLGCRTGRRF